MMGIQLFPTNFNVEEVSSESDNSEESENEEDAEDLNNQDQTIDFNPKHFYWLFNHELKFNKRSNFSVDDDLNP